MLLEKKKKYYVINLLQRSWMFNVNRRKLFRKRQKSHGGRGVIKKSVIHIHGF